MTDGEHSSDILHRDDRQLHGLFGNDAQIKRAARLLSLTDMLSEMLDLVRQRVEAENAEHLHKAEQPPVLRLFLNA